MEDTNKEETDTTAQNVAEQAGGYSAEGGTRLSDIAEEDEFGEGEDFEEEDLEDLESVEEEEPFCSFYDEFYVKEEEEVVEDQEEKEPSLTTLDIFAELQDPGLDFYFHYTKPEVDYEVSGRDKYVEICKEQEIVPISRIIKSLENNVLDLTFYGLSVKQMNALSNALKINSFIKYLNLEDNWMAPQSAEYIGDILRENCAIRKMNLRQCRIGEEGAQRIAEGLSLCQICNEIDLSHNDLGDKGLESLKDSFAFNSALQWVDLSHNNLGSDSGGHLEFILTENITIEHLDLSWNQLFRAPCLKSLCNGLNANKFIKWLNLSWTGIGGKTAMPPLFRFIKEAEVLEYLDLSNNRIASDSVPGLKVSLSKNVSLTKVKLGYNMYNSSDAVLLASVLLSPTNNIMHLGMENMSVDKKILELKRKLHRLGKTVSHGRILGNWTIKGPDVNKVLFERCKYLAMKQKKQKLKKDFGHFMLKLPDENMDIFDLKILIKKAKVKKIDDDLLKELVKKFSVNPKKPTIANLGLMKQSFMELYPDTVLPPEPEPKKKKGKKGGKKGKVDKKKEASADQEGTERKRKVTIMQ